MKKLLLTLLTVVCAVSAWAEEKIDTLAFSTSNNGITITKAGAGEPGGDTELSKGSVTVTSAGGQAQANKALQIYKTKSMTVSVPSNCVIKSIDFTYASSCYPFSEAIPTGISNATTKTTNDKNTATFTPVTPASSFTFTNIASGQTKINNMKVHYEQVGATVNVTGVSLNKNTASLNIGETTTLTATITPANANNKSVTWTTSDANVATVSNAGVVTGVGAGNATITVKTVDGNYTATCSVTVTAIAVTGITLDKTEASIMEGDTETLVATITPANAANKNITWTSSNETVATVDNGVVTAVSVGNAVITATTVDGSFTATCTVTVTPFVEPNEIEIIFAANDTDADTSTSWNTSSSISNVFSDGARYVSNITAINNVYPARNSLVNGVKFGTSSAAGSITLSLDKTYNVSKIVVTAAPYGDSEGQNGFTLNSKDVAMTGGKNKVYADYDVDITGDVSNIILTQKTAKNGRIYVKSIKLVKVPTSADITVSAAGYTTYYNSTTNYVMPTGMEGYVWFEGALEKGFDAGDVVKAGEPLVLKANAGNYTLSFTNNAAIHTYKADDMNDLEGTDDATAITPDNDYYFYGLSLNSSNDINSVGFYWMAAEGAAFTNGANKAYLKLPKTPGAKSAFRFNNTTGIKTLNNEQSVSNAVKRIMNGQLIIEKAGKMYNAAGAEVNP